MKTVQHSIRLPAALDTALRALADRQGKTVYAMLRRCVKTGIDGQGNPNLSSSDDRELVAEVASISTRLADVERLGLCGNQLCGHFVAERLVDLQDLQAQFAAALASLGNRRAVFGDFRGQSLQLAFLLAQALTIRETFLE